jgi:hypothetical protein
MADGITQPVVRRATGLWAREAVAVWHETHRDDSAILIGETPFVGGRFTELARPVDDAAEALLMAPGCVFVLAVPSNEVRSYIEGERLRRAAAPVDAREREDAPPQVLQDSWRELVEAGALIGLDMPAPGASYDAAGYRAVYKHLLRYRNVEVLEVDVTLPTQMLSVYRYEAACTPLVPSDDEASRFIATAEAGLAAKGSLPSVERWWDL